MAAPPPEVITKASPRSVEDTVTRFGELASEKGVKVFAVIDHSGEAQAVGLELPDTKLVIFGSPRAGTPAMQAAPLIALDLPLKILVWDEGGHTGVSYLAPAALAARYDLSEELAAPLRAIDALTDALIAS